MELAQVISDIFVPAFAGLPAKMDTPSARVQLLTIGQQESRFQYRRQLGNGPARGFWQFELGNAASRGGVTGIWLHPVSRPILEALCACHGIAPNPSAIWAACETDDAFACGVARIALWTDATPLPPVGNSQAAWACYLRVWNPGKPKPDTWGGFYSKSLAALGL